MTQIANYGRTAKQMLSEGQQSSKGPVPLGAYFDDGISKFRWGYVIDATPRVGVPFKKNQSLASCLAVPGAVFTQSATNGGYGNGAGQTLLRVEGLSGLTAARAKMYTDGYLYILSSEGRGPGVYRVDYAEVGKSGTAGQKNSFSLIKLKDPIINKLSTGSRGILRPNPYYGVREYATSYTLATTQAAPAGIGTASGATSGYQLFQTAGPGIVRMSGACPSGIAIGIGTSLCISSFISKITGPIPMTCRTW